MWRTRHITGCSGLSCLPEKAHRLCSIVFYNTLRILTVVSCVFACKHSWLLEWISPPFSKKKREKKQHVIGCYEAYFEGKKKHILGISENRIISYLKIWTSISHKIQKRCDWCVNPWTLTAHVCFVVKTVNSINSKHTTSYLCLTHDLYYGKWLKERELLYQR